MYIWCALDVSEALSEVRLAAIDANRDIGVSEVAFSLPQHISLLISFRAEDQAAESIITDIKALLLQTPVPDPELASPEHYKNIIWIPAIESDELSELHRKLIKIIHEKYGIKPHEFDLDFRFHSTLFIDDDVEKMAKIAARVSHLPIPARIKPNGYIIGVSETGVAGEYRVIHRLENSNGQNNQN